MEVPSTSLISLDFLIFTPDNLILERVLRSIGKSHRVDIKSNFPVEEKKFIHSLSFKEKKEKKRRKMSNHLLFMKGIIIKPIFILKKDYKSGRRPSKLVPDALDVYIDDIVEESIIDINTKNKIIVNRIFVGSNDGGNYTNVGWLLNDDIHYCMLCRTSFGMFTYKHHCKACGNIVCQACSENRAYIFEIQSLGMFRTCNLCYFGQVR